MHICQDTEADKEQKGTMKGHVFISEMRRRFMI